MNQLIADLSAVILAPHLVPPREREELGGGDEAVARVRPQLVAVLLVVLRGGTPLVMIPRDLPLSQKCLIFSLR